MKKIEKLIHINTDEKQHVSPDTVFEMCCKINEIIDYLNQSQKEPEKQEEWREEWRKLSFEIGSITKQQADEIEDFISKLLKEKTFSKEELNRLSIWSGDVGSFGVVSDEDAELINKIYKLLDGEKE
jgi:uncharacterized protein with PIN domain